MAGPNLTLLTDQLDFWPVVSAVLFVFSSWLVVDLVRVAIRMITEAIRYEPGISDWESRVIDEANDMQLRGETPIFDRMMARASIRNSKYF